MSGLLSHEPVITARTAQPYVAIRRSVTMQTMDQIADRIPDVLAWVGERGIVPAGPPFLRYLVIDMARGLDVEAGVPVDVPVEGDGSVIAGVLPGGRYVTLAQVGHPDALEQVTGDLLAWAARQGLVWDSEPTPEGERWGCRVEHYLTDPRDEPDMGRWTTELTFRLADGDASDEVVPPGGR